MSRFPCTHCGTPVEEPTPGRPSTCPGCGEVFEAAVPGAADLPPPAREYETRDRPGAHALPIEQPAHSGLGVASSVIGLIVIVLDILILILVLVLASGRAGRREMQTIGAVAGVFNCLGVVACLIGLALGVGGLFQEYRNRTFAVVGAVLNGAVILLITGVLLWALAASWGPF